MSGISKTVPEIEREIQIINRRCLRFRKVFKQEKEEAILKGVQSLIILRERSRTHYCPEIVLLIREIKKIVLLLKRIEVVPLTIFEQIEDSEIELKKTLAHMTSTPNRLLRGAKENQGENSV